MRIDARAHEPGHLHALAADLSHDVGDHAGGGDDADAPVGEVGLDALTAGEGGEGGGDGDGAERDDAERGLPA